MGRIARGLQGRFFAGAAASEPTSAHRARVVRTIARALAIALLLAATPAAAQPVGTRAARARPPGAGNEDRTSFRARLTGPRLARELSDPSVARRVAAAASLGRMGAPAESVDALIEALPREPAGQVRAEIVRSLARRGDPRAVPVLVEALAEGRGPGSEATIAALAAFGTGEAIAALVSALDDPMLRRSAIEALVRVGPRAIPPVVERLEEAPSPLPRIEAVGRIGSPLATPALLAAVGTHEPLLRAAGLVALARIGDPRAARAAIAALDDPDAAVRRAAIGAVSATGTRADAARLDRLLTGSPEADAPVWRAMLRLDPARAGAALATLAPNPTLVAVASERPRPELLPVYERWLADPAASPADARTLLSAVSEVADTDAVALLAARAERRPDERGAIAVALALSLARAEAPIAEAARARAASVIAALDDPTERLLLLAIADPEGAAPAVSAALVGDDPRERGAAALALATTDVPCAPDALREAAARDADDPELFRRLSEAAVRCRVGALASTLRPFLLADATGPEAMAWAAISGSGGPQTARRALGRTLRAALRSEVPRVRAGAARALALLGDEGARAALARLLEDATPGVRRAVARALEVLGPGDVVAELEAAARVESDPFLRVAFEDAARSGGDPEGFDRRGRAFYLLDARAGAGQIGELREGGASVRVDLVDAVGRFRRFEPGAASLLIVGLPEGPVQPTVAVEASPTGGRPAPSGSLATEALGP